MDLLIALAVIGTSTALLAVPLLRWRRQHPRHWVSILATGYLAPLGLLFVVGHLVMTHGWPAALLLLLAAALMAWRG